MVHDQYCAYALDIETISRGPDPSFSNPSDWRPFVIALAYRSGNETESEVFIRTKRSIRGESDLINTALDWMQERGQADKLLTYNGDRFDIPILRHRASQVQRLYGSQTSDRIESLFERIAHDDLFTLVREQWPEWRKWPTLEEAIFEYRIDSSDDGATNQLEYDDQSVNGKVMVEIGKRLLGTGVFPASEIEVVDRYARSDVLPLFDLHQKLARQSPVVLEG